MKRRLAMVIGGALLSLMVLSGCAIPSLSLSSLFPEAAPAEAVALEEVVHEAAELKVETSEAPAVGDLVALEDALEQIYREVSPSVVNIQVVVERAPMIQGLPQGPDSPEMPELPEGLPELPFEFEMPQDPQPGVGLGSGFVWDKDGHIVTNNHVVADAIKITVTFPDGAQYRGEVVGTDPHSDLAVIKIDAPADELHPITVADSTRVNVGQLAVAIGNPFGLDGTMTVGFVSALGRSLPVAARTMAASYSIPDIIQTDAPINPGNSGGVLVDSAGRLIGVPTAIESPVRANAGIGFAVPSAIVANVVPDLISTGAHEHPWLGFSGTTINLELAEAMGVDPEQRGVLVIDVTDGSPVDEAGLRGSDKTIEIEGQEALIGGDVIVAIDGEEVREFDDLIIYLSRSTSVGQTVTLTILRDGEEESVEVTLRARPSEAVAEEQSEPEMAGGVWLGIVGADVTPEIAEAMGEDADTEGVLVAQIASGSPADEAGLRGSYKIVEIDGQPVQIGGDIIVALDGEQVSGMGHLKALIDETEPGQDVTLTLLRDGEEIELVVTLGERPAQAPQ